jgi:hypothetical protein
MSLQEPRVSLVSDGQRDVEPYTGKWAWILDHTLFMGCAFYATPILIIALTVIVVIG